MTVHSDTKRPTQKVMCRQPEDFSLLRLFRRPPATAPPLLHLRSPGSNRRRCASLSLRQTAPRAHRPARSSAALPCFAAADRRLASSAAPPPCLPLLPTRLLLALAVDSHVQDHFAEHDSSADLEIVQACSRLETDADQMHPDCPCENVRSKSTDDKDT